MRRVFPGTNRWIGASSAEQEAQPWGRPGETPSPPGGGEPAPRLRLSAPRKDEFGGASAPRTTWMSGERLGLPPRPGQQHPGRGGPSRSPLTAAPGLARACSVAGPGEPLWAEHPGRGGPSRSPRAPHSDPGRGGSSRSPRAPHGRPSRRRRARAGPAPWRGQGSVCGPRRSKPG
ncbi:uncharacterized protein LOC115903700 [Camarhynchus parvulus]|uniref:uncharacterized protein LOC115903700 n=1 Tax=Geospiza parvula TaxID=87175 RepID=UPI001237C453|nr:uncharacterized protein LOC115903700 [Camarhynchus parvulus]